MTNKKLLLYLVPVFLIAGIVLITKGNLIGVLFFLAALALFVTYTAIMNRIAGNSTRYFCTGEMNGQGRQQSEVLKLNQEEAAPFAPSVWDAMDNAASTK